MGLLILIVMALVGGVFIFYKGTWLRKKFFTRYPVTVIIWEQRGEQILPMYIDKGRRVFQKSGKILYEFKNTPGMTQAFEFNAISANNWLHVVSLSSGEYHPILFDFKNATKQIPKVIINAEGNQEVETDAEGNTVLEEIKIPFGEIEPVMTQSAQYVYTDAVRSTHQRYYKPDFMTKYMPLAIILAVSMGIMLILWGAIGQMAPFADAFKAAASNCGALISAASNAPLPIPPA